MPYPRVSIVTPTFNRRVFIKKCRLCILDQTYPQNKIEWLIFDDGDDKIKDLVEIKKQMEILLFVSMMTTIIHRVGLNMRCKNS